MVKNIEKILKVLGNRKRLAILALLKNRKEVTVGEIAKSINLSITATSRHLSKLWNLNLIEKEQKSLEVYYSIIKEQDGYIKAVFAEL